MVSPTTTATDPRAPGRLLAARRWLARPIDAAALASFRIAFGALLLVAVVRFAAKDMISEAFVTPRTFFPLVPGLGPLPAPGMHVVFAVLGLAALALTVGYRAQPAAALFCALFTYAHLADLTNYLNHYHLVSLLTALLAVLPCARVCSVDARRAGTTTATVPAWTLALLRFQIACVYVFAGLAKLRGDWLSHGLPLRIWLPGSGDVPLLGPVLARAESAYVMSWAGALFDLSIPFWLLWRRSRPFALGAVVLFHLLTVPLFRLGMFPFFMIAASLVFLEPGWSRRWLGATPAPAAPAPPAPVRPYVLAFAAVWAAIQIALPLRQHLHAGNVLWTERGYRFAWNVMLMEKNGVADFVVADRATGRRVPVRLADHLTPLQSKMLATQPDLLRAFARHLASQARRRGQDVTVHADVVVSLNGRPAQPLVDPAIDLAAEQLPRGWILPAPEAGPPPRFASKK